MNLLNFTIVKPVYAGPNVPGTSGTGLGSVTGVGQFQNITDTAAQTGKFVSGLITTLTIFGSLAFVVFFSLGALKWITAGGDKTKVGEAQAQMTQGAIGLIAMVASYFIIGIVGAVLGLDILNPIKTLQNAIF